MDRMVRGTDVEVLIALKLFTAITEAEPAHNNLRVGGGHRVGGASCRVPSDPPAGAERRTVQTGRDLSRGVLHLVYM